MRTILIVVFLSLCTLALPGCVVAAVGLLALGGSSYEYSKGTLLAEEKETLNTSWSVTQDVAHSLRFHIVEVSQDEKGAELVAIAPDDLRIHIELKSESKSRTTFSIRVGDKGDEKKSRNIMDMIHKKL